jgi:hypothetical protein
MKVQRPSHYAMLPELFFSLSVKQIIRRVGLK